MCRRRRRRRRRRRMGERALHVEILQWLLHYLIIQRPETTLYKFEGIIFEKVTHTNPRFQTSTALGTYYVRKCNEKRLQLFQVI
jgi:hypothetical protein